MGARASNAQAAKRRGGGRKGNQRKILYITLGQVLKWVQRNGGDEETYRLVLANYGAEFDQAKGKYSASSMSDDQIRSVIAHFSEKGFKPPQPAGGKGGRGKAGAKRKPGHASAEQVKKIYALWHQLADLHERYKEGVRSREKTALGKWIGRQLAADRVGVATAPEMLSTKNAHRIIEELKAWAKRIVDPRLKSAGEAIQRRPSGPRGRENYKHYQEEHQYLSGVSRRLSGER